jgi:hypothetical protein
MRTIPPTKFLTCECSAAVSSLIEMLVAQRDNTLAQLARCAHWYRERALRDYTRGVRISDR